MSKKKDKKIKRLRRLPVWPTIVSLILVESVVFVITLFLCWCTLSGIAVSVITQSEKECRSVVKTVNEYYLTDSKAELNERINYIIESSSTLNEVTLDEGKGILTLYPDLETAFDMPAQDLFERNKMIRFIDPDSERVMGINFHRAKDEDFGEPPLDSEEKKKTSVPKAPEGGEFREAPKGLIYSFQITDENGVSQPYILDIKNIIRTLKFEFINNYELTTWTAIPQLDIPVISIYKTDISNLNVCIKNVYAFNTYQLSLMVLLFIVLLLILILVSIYEISKVVNIIGERKRINRLVTIDTVTGGFNKDYFIQKASKEIIRGRKKYAVVQFRLEKYRNYCTAYGLKQGENLLEEINTILSQMLNKKELVAHIEKSDFAILLDYQNNETLEIRVRNMMNILRERRGGQHLTFSVGICPVRSKSDDIEHVMTCAGLAVPKTIKIQDEIVWFNDSMKEEQVWERRIEDDMDKALENHEFQVYLQPKYSTKKEVLSAAEALVRWTHPVLGFISPGKFIPIFERNGFILQLDDYMLTEVARLQAGWESQGKKLVPISVNVSRAHFAEDNLAEHICSIVDRFKVPHQFIELELTESAFFDDKEVLLTTVRKLKDFGFKVSMDDFGAGYSSLNSLKELPLDIIKLDAEFFRSVDDVKRSNLIVGETIALAKKLGMEIVAEGIETRDQVDFLAKQDCDLIQGFFFSKPLPVSEFEERAYGKAINE